MKLPDLILVPAEGDYSRNPGAPAQHAYELAAWPRALLHAAISDPGESRASVARQLGCSRTAISLLINGKYPARTDKIAALIVKRYGRMHCPHLGAEISGAECHGYHTRETPTSSPLAMRHWRACQGCEHNRTKKGSA